jgi:hypothetical protein
MYNADGTMTLAWSKFFDGIAAQSATAATASAATSTNVIITGITASYGATPDAFGNLSLTVTVTYVVPPTWTGIGVDCWYEFPDQSATPNVLKLDGTSTLDGSASLAGNWHPIDFGKTLYDPAASVHEVKFTGLIAPADPTDFRAYLITYDANSTPALVRATAASGATPSTVITVVAPSATTGAPVGGSGTGVEYAGNLTGLTASAGTAFDRGDGKLVTPITLTFGLPQVEIKGRAGAFTYRTDTRLVGVAFHSVWDNPTAPPEIDNIPVGKLVGGSYVINLPTTAVLTTITIYALSYDKTGNVNTYVPGVTPSAQITMGSVTGTINLNNTILTSVASYFSTNQGFFGIVGNSLDAGALLQGLSVSQAQLAAGAVTATKIANLAVTTAAIANAAIGTLQVANGAIIDAHIANLSASKITAGTISAVTITALTCNGGAITGTSLTLALNGITTAINNTSLNGNASGLLVSGVIGTTPAVTYIAQVACTGLYLTSNAIGFGHPGGVAVNLIGGFPVLSLSDSSANNGQMNAQYLSFGGSQVLTARQAGPGNPVFATLGAAQTWCAALLAALQVHGLVT